MNVDRYDKDYNCESIIIHPKEIKTLNRDYIYYEKIEDKVKPFFDIDIYEIKYSPMNYQNYYNTLFKLIFVNGDIAISTSHSKERLSFHFVINGYEYELNKFNDFIQNHPILSIDDNIDKTIYTKRPEHYKVNFIGYNKIVLRLLYSMKSHEDRRVKIPYNYNNDIRKHCVTLI